MVKKNKNTGGVKMTFSIEVENGFEMNPRDIQLRRKSRGETLEEHQVCPLWGSGRRGRLPGDQRGGG